jgi:muramoyltetrapeptide carboxypeptidase
MIKPAEKPAQNVGVAIVAPGGYAPDDAALLRGIALLEAQGCRVRNYYEPAARHLRFGATDGERVAQLHAAANDPEVQIVMALRGSYGMSRILPLLDFKMLAESGKLFVGNSDFTAFQLALLALTGAVSFAGPMLCDDFTREDFSKFTMDHFWDCLSNPVHEVLTQTKNNPAVRTSGMLWGGNLAMLTHLVGSSYLPQVDQGILFVEDVSEHPFRVERMMLQLLHAGVLARQKAVLLGDFSNYRLSDYDDGYNFDTMLAFLRSRLPVPVLTGLPFGHIRDKVTLAVGGQAEVVASENTLRLVMSDYPTLKVRP